MNDKTEARTKAEEAKANSTATETKSEAKVREEVEKSAANPAPATSAKSKELLDAANARAKALAERGEDQVAETQRRYDTEISDEAKEGAQAEADTRVQSRANSLTGAVDVEARGDVKGNGGDAKNYPDGDPDKYLSPTTAEYGLNDLKGGAPVRGVGDNTVSAKTQAEISRGKEALGARKPRTTR